MDCNQTQLQSDRQEEKAHNGPPQPNKSLREKIHEGHQKLRARLAQIPDSCDTERDGAKAAGQGQDGQTKEDYRDILESDRPVREKLDKINARFYAKIAELNRKHWARQSQDGEEAPDEHAQHTEEATEEPTEKPTEEPMEKPMEKPTEENDVARPGEGL